MGQKAKKMGMILGLVLIILAAVFLAGRGIVNYLQARKVEDIMEKLKTERKPLLLEDIEIECREENNGALIWKEIERKLKVKEERAFLRSVFSKIIYARNLSEEELARVKKLLELNKEALALFPGVVNRSCFKYMASWPSLGVEIEFPNLVVMTDFERLFNLETYLKADRGEVEEAINRINLMLDFSLKILDEPFLMLFMEATKIYRNQLELLNDIVVQKNIQGSLLIKLMEKLNKDVWQAKLSQVIENERVIFLNLFQACLDREEKALSGLGLSSWKVWALEPIIRLDFIYGLKAFEECEQLIKVPYSDWPSLQRASLLKKKQVPSIYFLSSLLNFDFGQVLLREKILEAKIEVTRLGLACRLFKEEMEHWPKKLSDLVPMILPEIPVDPFTGKQLIYRKNNQGIKIYSVGANQKDDGGREPREFIKNMLAQDDDWTWIDEKK